MLDLGIYRHYKGNYYEVIGIATHSETLEEMVVYRAMYENYVMWTRPLSMWEDQILIDGTIVDRFHKVDKNDLV